MKRFIDYGFAGEKNDSEELRLIKRIIFWIAIICSVCGLVWGGMFFYFYGLVPVVFLPTLFFFIVGGAIIIAHKKANYKILVYVQIICITWIGAFIQWNLGTIHDSGAVLVWTFLGPFGSLIFLSKKEALIWFVFFLLILFVTVIFEPFLSSKTINITPLQTKIFFIMNIGVTFSIVFAGSLYFLRGLEKEKAKVGFLLKETNKKNKSITDSINYAKRLQLALLPSDKMVADVIPNSFVFYKPKDIVSGDFYWVNDQYKKLFAVVDCTGHGVPGAMVSVICNAALNRSVRELKLTSPGEILNKSREIIIEEFEKSEEVVTDGMDVVLCSIDNYKLEYAGAHNPLWIVRDNKLIEIKADNQSVSKYENPITFKNNTFDLQKGDVVYLFSDGYRDQFGGENNKRLKIKGFRNLILSISNKSMSEQKEALHHFFNKWKGSFEQIDDVCVIGVKID